MSTGRLRLGGGGWRCSCRGAAGAGRARGLAGGGGAGWVERLAAGGGGGGGGRGGGGWWGRLGVRSPPQLEPPAAADRASGSWRPVFVEGLSCGRSVSEACSRAGVSRALVYRERRGSRE